MHLPRSDGHRKNETVFVVGLFRDRSYRSADAYSVTAHYRVERLTVLAVYGHAHSLGVFSAQLEDIAYLYAVLDPEIAAAYRAFLSRLDFGYIAILNVLEIAVGAYSCIVIFGLVRAAYHIVRALYRLIVHDRKLIRKTYRADIAADDILAYSAVVSDYVLAESLFELRFVDFEVASYERDDQLVLLSLDSVNDRLYRLVFGYVKTLADLFYRLVLARIYLFELRGSVVVLVQYRGSDFHICAVIAFIAEHDAVFARFCYQHELVSDTAAHHACIRLYVHEILKTYPSENAVIRVEHSVIVFFKLFRVVMERVRVFHREFSDPYKSAAGACLIAVLCLDLVYHHRQLLIAGYGMIYKMHRRFFVSHAEEHIVIVPVLETHHLRAYRRVSSA